MGLADPQVRPLLAGLRTEYEERYGQNEVLADAQAAEFEAPAGAFVVLLDGAETVAGGGFRRVDELTCEVKRMWTAPGHRRRGHAGRVLGHLERLAAAAGYRRIRLETGPAQPEAIALYGQKGYRRIGNYGPYQEAVAFERRL